MHQPTDYLARGAQKTLIGKAVEVPNPGGVLTTLLAFAAQRSVPMPAPPGAATGRLLSQAHQRFPMWRFTELCSVRDKTCLPKASKSSRLVYLALTRGNTTSGIRLRRAPSLTIL